MARRKPRRKNANRKKTAKDRPARKMPRKPVLALLFGILLIAVLVGFLKHSGYFLIDDIAVLDQTRATKLKAEDLLDLYGNRNIFDVDISALAASIKREYPVIKDAIVRRVLPATLEIEIIPRVAVAKIKSYDYFPIDKTGMVLSPEAECGRVPLIIGLSIWTRPNVGERLKGSQIQSAFELIRALNKNRAAEELGIKTIDVSNYRNLSFYLDNDIEIKIGGEDFQERLNKLRRTLSNPDLDTTNIKYIDLRFEGVVIGPK